MPGRCQSNHQGSDCPAPARDPFAALLSSQSPEVFPNRRPQNYGATPPTRGPTRTDTVAQSRQPAGDRGEVAGRPAAVLAQTPLPPSQEHRRLLGAHADESGKQSWSLLIASIAAPIAYMVLYTIYDIMLAKQAQDGPNRYYRFEPACMVFVIEMGKLLVTLPLLAMFTPAEFPTLGEVCGAAAGLSLVAVCFTGVNVIQLISLAKVSLASYGVWYQTGIIFNAILWYVAFRTPLGLQKCFALLILTIGCVVNAIQPGMTLHFDVHILIVISSAFLSALGCVLNEYCFKRQFQMDLNIQNLVLYSETAICCLILIAVVHPERLHSRANFFDGFTHLAFATAGLSVCIGLCVSRMLKYASTITKNFAMALHCPIEVVFAHYVVGSPLTVFTLVSAILIGIATCTYYLAPAEKETDVTLPLKAKPDELVGTKPMSKGTAY